MGIILDTCVFIDAERNPKVIPYLQDNGGPVFIASITISEILVGVHLASNEKKRLKRSAFIEGILSKIPILPLTEEVSRLHSEIYAFLSKKGRLIGAHDFIIGSTAVFHGYSVLTRNVDEFRRIPGLNVLSYDLDELSS